MKLLFKLNRKVNTINNIGVDDKCLPLIGGSHPYSSKSDSPLTRESALWFKSLALDSIFVDCDKCHIFWSSIENDVGQEVMLRRQSLTKSLDEFIPGNAKPLFEDLTLFDFDPSLKEMMGKCTEVAEKISKSNVSTSHINSKVANLLHVYILPSIHFSIDDMYALSHTRCLIEERLMKADSEISNKAYEKSLLEVSLCNLKDNLIHTYDFESESYLRSCDPVFLKVFLSKVEEESRNVNLSLEAQQSTVNWAKSHPDEYQPEDVKDLQKKRDDVFREVEKLIKIRESLRNVVTRKEKYKKKKKKKTKLEHIENCFQSIYVEINRRWDLSVKAMDQMIVDKVNISGAREATLAAILELNETNRHSDRSTRFEPADFGDCRYDGVKESEKPSSWLTLQERVSYALKDVTLDAYRAFTQGCSLILSQIELAQSEFSLTYCEDSTELGRNCVQDHFKEELPVMRKKKGLLTEEVMGRRSGFVFKDKNVSEGMCSEVPNTVITMTNNQKLNGDLEGVLSSGLVHNNHAQNQPLATSQLENMESNYVSIPEGIDKLSSAESLTSVSNSSATKHLALKDLTHAIDNLKVMVQDHFGVVIKCLQRELEIDWSEDAVVIDLYVDKGELIWKAYERHFSEKVLSPLTSLYETALIQIITSTYDTLSKMSIQDILEDDKILSLFFNDDLPTPKSFSLHRSLSCGDPDSFSMARTASEFSLNILDYSAKDLYDFANADSDDILRRFNMKEEDSLVVSSSSSDSGASVKTSDLFGEEEDKSQGGAAANPLDQKDLMSSDHSRKATKALESCRLKSFIASPEALEESQSSTRSSHSNSGSNSSSAELRCSKGTSLMDFVFSPFTKQMQKCIRGKSIMDKLRYLSKAIEVLNKAISKLYGEEHQSACDDILTMLILALSQMPKDIFIGLYVNLNLLRGVLPKFLTGSLCEYNLISLVASYDFLNSRKFSQRVIRRDHTV